MPKAVRLDLARRWPDVPPLAWEVAVFESGVKDPQVDEDIHVQEIRRRITSNPRR